MKIQKRRASVAAVMAMTLAGVGVAFAADKSDIGKMEYQTSCAVCHGADGKGGGSFAQVLQLSMPDLTTMARRNGGVFPVVRVYDIIDGREDVKAHGTREMPIWGSHFGCRAAPVCDDYPYDAEVAARARTLMVIDYLYRIQAK